MSARVAPSGTSSRVGSPDRCMMTKTMLIAPQKETTDWAARLSRKAVIYGRTPSPAWGGGGWGGGSPAPLHVEDEERLVRRRLPFQLLARRIDRDVLIERDAGHV